MASDGINQWYEKTKQKQEAKGGALADALFFFQPPQQSSTTDMLLPEQHRKKEREKLVPAPKEKPVPLPPKAISLD